MPTCERSRHLAAARGLASIYGRAERYCQRLHILSTIKKCYIMKLVIKFEKEVSSVCFLLPTLAYEKTGTTLAIYGAFLKWSGRIEFSASKI